MMRMLLFSLVMLLAYVPVSYAQTATVKGTVTDASGNPLVGVNVIVKGTTIGTTTLTDGKYVVNFPPPSQTLVFTYIGMVTQEVKVDGRSTVNVVMKEDAGIMDEVVVVGYGTQKKVHMTGSVVAVSGDEIMKTTSSNISQALVGKLPGITTQQATGAPGADGVTIQVRGTSSFNGSTPLYIVDGIERPMGLIDPNDVESISVLKDAASCAIYGMRAASGVILITTKKGQKGAAVVNYRGSVTLSHLTMFPKFMNGTQYMKYYNMGLELDGLKPYFTQEEIDMTYNGDPSDGLENTNWQSPLYRTTLMHQHNISVSGGTDKVNYFVSGGFLNQNGILAGHENQRANFRSNIDINPWKNLKVALNVAGTVQDLYQPGGRSYENQKAFNVFHLMMYSLPFVPKQLEKDGVLYPTSAYRTAANNTANAEYESEHTGFSKSRNLRLETSANIEYSFPFLKGLKAGMSVGWDWKYGSGKTFSYKTQLLGFTFSRYEGDNRPEVMDRYTLGYSSGLEMDGNMFVSKTEEQQIVLRPQISYTNKFGKHDVGALFLYEQTTFRQDVLSGGRKSFDLLDLPELKFGSAASATNDGYLNKKAYAGYAGRLNYAYDDKYLVEASFRYDGSYLFHKDHRWGFFPSVSVGWVMSHENFFKEALPKIEYLKLRVSHGVLGSDNVDPYLYRKNYGYSANSVAFGTSPTSQGTLYNNVSYPFIWLTWERCRTTDVGFELSAWNGLLGVEFDYFYKYTYDILQNISNVYPASLGGHYPTRENTGTFDNRGFELILKHRNSIGKFNYSVTGNLSYAHNRVLSRVQADNTLPWQSVLGRPYGAIWGYKSDGLYQTQEELENAPKPVGVQPRLGDIKYVDINGDGQITSQDQVEIARARMPEMMFSLTLDADWKGFDISVQLQGAARTDRMLQEMWYRGFTDGTKPVSDMTPLTTPWYGNYDNAPLYLVENSWRPDNTNAEYPRLSVAKQSYANNSVVSDFWKRNGAYLRLKNVTLGYTFPRKWTNKIGIGNLRVYASGYNLLTATEFKYLDPESTNVVTGYYPQQRTFSFGVDVSF